jgi:nitroimidazol reductase NimA-like FMN-containing flavoprotein (pyridoxamine 5'-phosphate oxidase superfamily)
VIRDLTPSEIDEVLREELIGRIGCWGNRRILIVPLAYAYDGASVYCYSADGAKVRFMRVRPEVCFQVDHIDDIANWRSVIAWGTFHELADEEAQDAVDRISIRLHSAASRRDAATMRTYVERRHEFGVAYKLVLKEKAGRLESTPIDDRRVHERRRG